MARRQLVRYQGVHQSIVRIRAMSVLLDADLAALYGVETKALVRAVRRNRDRFPGDFMFQLTAREFANLRSQFGTSRSWGGRRYRPFAFTEQGVAMLSSVLRGMRAARVNIEIMRAFVRLRHVLESNVSLSRKLADLERRYDAQFAAVFQAIRDLMEPPAPSRRRIGFQTPAGGQTTVTRVTPDPGRRSRAGRRATAA